MRFKVESAMDVIDIAKRVFSIESKAILELPNSLTNDFKEMVSVIERCKGTLIVLGMGKSGIVGKKIAATLTSTGTPSVFVHPAEAFHGDLGVIKKRDIVLMISSSGETDEMLQIIPYLKKQENVIIAMSGNMNSTLASNSDYQLNIYVEEEACPLKLAPTSSTTAAMAMGDAVAVVLMQLRGFKAADFAQYHPGGNLGKRLLTSVRKVMRDQELPICGMDESIKDVIHVITSGKCGMAIVMDESKVMGVITDGDLRRAMEASEDFFFGLNAKDIMTYNPKKISERAKIATAESLMHENKVGSLVVENEFSEFVGVVQLYDLERYVS